MFLQQWRHRAGDAIFLLAIMVLAACASGTATVTVNGPNPTATVANATATPISATATPTSATQCAQVAGFAGAGPATSGNGFNDVPFPNSSISTPLVLHSAGIGLFTIYLYNVCSPSTNKSGIQAFYTSQMVANNWSYSPTLPFDGGYQAACGDPYCWLSNLAPRYLGLENVTEVGNGLVTYRMRIFVPPPVDDCPLFNNNYIISLPQHHDVPLPPRSVLGVGHGSGSIMANDMCSAGDQTSVQTFMTTELTKLNWHQGTFSPGGGATFNCGGAFVGWISPDGTHAISFDTAHGSATSNGWLWTIESCH